MREWSIYKVDSYGNGVFIILIKPTYTINVIKINVETNS